MSPFTALFGGYLPYTRPQMQPSLPPLGLMPQDRLTPLPPTGPKVAQQHGLNPIYPGSGYTDAMRGMAANPLSAANIDELIRQRAMGGWMNRNLGLGLGWLGGQAAAGAQGQLNTRAQADQARRYSPMGLSGNVYSGSGYTDKGRSTPSKSSGDKGGAKRK